MKKIPFIVACILLWNCDLAFSGNVWKKVDNTIAGKTIANIRPGQYLSYRADEAALRDQLFQLPQIPEQGQTIELPMPDGTMRSFRVWHTPIMPDALAKRYPNIRTFTAQAVDNSHITAKLDFTPNGFHAMIFEDGKTSFIDPAGTAGNGYYTVHYKKDAIPQEEQMSCVALHDNKAVPAQKGANLRVSNGYQLRSYRLALACSHQYAQAVTNSSSPTIADVLSWMTTTMNRVNGVYEREFSVTMQFVPNEDALIWTLESGGPNGIDPFSNINKDATSCLTVNQTTCDSRIGTANYDIGHVFTTGAGGFSEVRAVCNSEYKASSVTGQPHPSGDEFDVDYVAHEMGHEFGADHTFNNNVNGSCAGNISEATAYEPGSGSTIMAYAGICVPDNLQPHSDPYFHAASLSQIKDYITTLGDVCAVKTPTGNKLVQLPSFTASYTIPYLTPFELSAPAATDSVADTSITYCWEQWNLGNTGSTFAVTHDAGPIFRSYLPVKSTDRIFPRKEMVLADSLSNAGTESAEGEKVPDVARFLTFRLTVRDILNGNGCFLIPDDTVHLDVINTGQGFKVTSQNTAGTVYLGNTFENITWDVAGTNVPPVNTTSVDIYLSLDSGNTWQYHIGTFANNGSALIKLPNPDISSSAARIKVKGNGNVFFNVNTRAFSLVRNADTTGNRSILLFPNPAHNTLYVAAATAQKINIYNAVGQLVWQGLLNGQLSISVSSLARGIYIMKLTDPANHSTIKKFVIN